MKSENKELHLSWNFHPRPQFKRENFYLLNGEWQLNGSTITVPFPPQSDLSEYKGDISDEFLYKKTFTIPDNFDKERIILHFGAVDQIATVYINKKLVGYHEGGYLPFSYDVTDYVYRDSNNLLSVVVKDDLSNYYPYGKQSKNPKGMWYTPVSGIWQTVWIENVPNNYITDIVMDADLNRLNLRTTLYGDLLREQGVTTGDIAMEQTVYVTIKLPNGNYLKKQYSSREGKCNIYIAEPVHWTPDNPYLYEFTITCGNDTVQSYFALRTIGIKNINGINRLCLNNNPIFLHGVLDQGYFKDGIYLPKDEKEYDNDILNMKDLGFNFLRKHAKIEPEYFYYACDRLGILVMQDMVNSGPYSYIRDTVLPTIGFKKRREVSLPQNNKRRQVFEIQMQGTVSYLYNHPCVIAYTIFNEGWGQFNSDEMYDHLKFLDSTRLIDSTSGWFAKKKSDFDSEHVYFRTKQLQVKERPLLMSECGGYQLLIKDHFYGKKEYGYGACKDKSELTERIVDMYEKMILPSIKDGVCGCIYTQLSDVEGEINGLYTYDRQICKVDKNRIQSLSHSISTLINMVNN